ALIIYVQHNASALQLLNVQNARGLISINVTFFLSLLGWQSVMALFMASFAGPGQQRALAVSGAAVFARRVRARQDVYPGDPDVADDLDSGSAAVPPARLPGGLELDDGQRADRIRDIFRFVDLDSAALAAGSGAF